LSARARAHAGTILFFSLRPCENKRSNSALTRASSLTRPDLERRRRLRPRSSVFFRAASAIRARLEPSRRRHLLPCYEKRSAHFLEDQVECILFFEVFHELHDVGMSPGSVIGLDLAQDVPSPQRARVRRTLPHDLNIVDQLRANVLQKGCKNT